MAGEQAQPQLQSVASGFLHRFGEAAARAAAGCSAATHVLGPIPPPLPSAVSQVATRLITFSVNLIIARQLSPELYGVRCASCPARLAGRLAARRHHSRRTLSRRS
jgi:hypothetical protein